jgi:hypothetical protein
MRKFLSLLVVGVVLPTTIALAAPKADLWPRWQQHDANSTAAIDHGAWDEFLRKFIVPSPDGINRVAYARVGTADKAALGAYVDRLAATPIGRYNRDEQKAYWINLYNAGTQRVILDHYPVASIRDIRISPGWFSVGPWGKKLFKIEGEELSLDDVEHRILRPIWNDPRVHYAVNCASLGCPNLAGEAYTPARLERMLDQAARDFLNHPRGVKVENGRLFTTSIFNWFPEDFGGSDAAIIEHIKRFARPELVQRLAGVRRIDSHDYDWALIRAPE